MGFFIQPSKKLPSPRASASTNSRIEPQADSHRPSGRFPSTEIQLCPRRTSQAWRIGFSNFAIRSGYSVFLTAVIFTLFIFFLKTDSVPCGQDIKVVDGSHAGLPRRCVVCQVVLHCSMLLRKAQYTHFPAKRKNG